MDSQTCELALRQRVIRSARGLVCSTFSGMAGIEAELRDSRVTRKRQVTSRPRDQSAPTGDLRRKSRRCLAMNGATSSFRSRQQDAPAAKTEDDFEYFTRDQSYAINDAELNSILPGTPVMLKQKPSGIPFSRPQTWHLAMDAQQKDDEMAVLDVEATTASLAQGFGVFHARHEEQSIARARLDQVHQHLNMTSYDMNVKPGLQPYEGQLQHGPFCSQPQVHRDFISPERTPMAWTSKSPRTTTDDDDQSVRNFHCPYVECHRNLLKQNRSASSSQQQRRCVHTSCDYVTETTREWLKHVTTPHHDLQGVEPTRDFEKIGRRIGI